MRAQVVKAIMMEAIEKQEEKIRTSVCENIEKYIFPYIIKEAKKGKSCTTVSVPEYKGIYASKLAELGYEVTFERGKKLLVRWA